MIYKEKKRRQNEGRTKANRPILKANPPSPPVVNYRGAGSQPYKILRNRKYNPAALAPGKHKRLLDMDISY